MEQAKNDQIPLHKRSGSDFLLYMVLAGFLFLFLVIALGMANSTEVKHEMPSHTTQIK